MNVLHSNLVIRLTTQPEIKWRKKRRRCEKWWMHSPHNWLHHANQSCHWARKKCDMPVTHMEQRPAAWFGLATVCTGHDTPDLRFAHSKHTKSMFWPQFLSSLLKPCVFLFYTFLGTSPSIKTQFHLQLPMRKKWTTHPKCYSRMI